MKSLSIAVMVVGTTYSLAVAAAFTENSGWQTLVAPADSVVQAIAAGKPAPAVMDALGALENAQDSLPPDTTRPIECWGMMFDAATRVSTDRSYAAQHAREAVACYRRGPTIETERGGAQRLHNKISNATGYYTAAKWQDLERRAAQAHAAAIGQPLAEPADPAARAEFERAVDSYRNGNMADAAKWFSKCAGRGDQYCELQLGWQYESGQGVGVNFNEAARLYTAAAKAGNAQAQVNLGTLYAQGKGVPLDNHEAVKWFAAAASQGNPDGLYDLARAYEFGLAVPRDRAKAIALYEEAALHGDLKSVEAARWLSDPTNVSFPDQQSRDAYFANGGGMPGGSGAFSMPEYRERQRRIACDNPQIPGNMKICHGQ